MSTICPSTFSNTESKVFWMTGTHMVAPERKLAALKEEGIYKPEYLIRFSKDDLDSVFESLCKPPGKVENKKVTAVAPRVILEKSMERITVAAEVTRYYDQVVREITPTNMHWETFSNFDIQWNALKNL